MLGISALDLLVAPDVLDKVLKRHYSSKSKGGVIAHNTGTGHFNENKEAFIGNAEFLMFVINRNFPIKCSALYRLKKQLASFQCCTAGIKGTM